MRAPICPPPTPPHPLLFTHSLIIQSTKRGWRGPIYYVVDVLPSILPSSTFPSFPQDSWQATELAGANYTGEEEEEEEKEGRGER